MIFEKNPKNVKIMNATHIRYLKLRSPIGNNVAE